MALDHGALVLAAMVVFVTHFLGAVAGFGSSMLALPLLILVLGTQRLATVVAALLIMGTVQALQMVWYTWRDIDRRELARMVVWMAAGMPLGALFLRDAPPGPAVLALGGVLITSGAVSLSRLGTAAAGAWRMAGPAVLAVAGAVHGAFASGGMVLSAYAQHALTDKERFRATLSVMWVAVNTLLLAFMLRSGRMDDQALRLGVAGALLAVPAGILGQRTALRVSQDNFSRLVSALLIAGGIAVVCRAALVELRHGG